jgi:tetratricopeptide (TPR) repeat protein
LIDQINLLQSQTHTSRPPASFRNNWGDDIKVEIPETGVSIGELSRLLHEQLGSATRIEGEVTYTPTGLSIVARIPEAPAIRATGAPSELDTLVQRIGEQAFASTQPYRYGTFLLRQGRKSEALALFRELAEHGPSQERPWGYAGVGLVSAELSGYEDALAAWRESLRLDPYQAISSTNIAEVARGVGLDKEALAELKRYQALSSGTLVQHFTAPAIAWANLLMQYLLASELGDHQNGIRIAQSMVTDTQFQAGAEKAYGAFAREELALNHDVGGNDDSVSDAEATAGLVDNSDYYVVMPNVLAAFERGDMARVETLCADLIKELLKPGVPVVFQQQIQRRIYPVLAEALARMGRYGETDLLLKEIPANSYDGWRARGRVAMLRRDFEAGEQAFSEAVRKAPTIPRAYSDWGDLLAAKGDIAGALVRRGA